MVAMHLLKSCHYLEDKDGFRVELRCLRDRTGRDVAQDGVRCLPAAKFLSALI
jgi:hypothetical protein